MRHRKPRRAPARPSRSSEDPASPGPRPGGGSPRRQPQLESRAALAAAAVVHRRDAGVLDLAQLTRPRAAPRAPPCRARRRRAAARERERGKPGLQHGGDRARSASSSPSAGRCVSAAVPRQLTLRPSTCRSRGRRARDAAEVGLRGLTADSSDLDLGPRPASRRRALDRPARARRACPRRRGASPGPHRPVELAVGSKNESATAVSARLTARQPGPGVVVTSVAVPSTS